MSERDFFKEYEVCIMRVVETALESPIRARTVR